MANTSEAIIWILKNSQQFNIEINSLKWINSFLPSWFDFSCSLKHNGVKLFSLGADSNSDIALCKSFSELMERLIVKINKYPTSNGLASHLSIEAANINATNEMIERDIFLCHYLTKSPFVLIPNEIIDSWGWLNYSVQWFKANSLKLTFYYLGESGVLTLIDGRNSKRQFGFIMGTSYKKSIEAAALNSFIEASRQAFLFIENTASSKNILSLSEFYKKTEHSFEDHGNLSLDVNYANTLDLLFTEKQKSLNKYILSGNMTHHLISTSSELLKDAPFYVVKASNPCMQDLFIGPTKYENINLQRLSSYVGKQISFDELNLLPHPFN